MNPKPPSITAVRQLFDTYALFATGKLKADIRLRDLLFREHRNTAKALVEVFNSLLDTPETQGETLGIDTKEGE